MKRLILFLVLAVVFSFHLLGEEYAKYFEMDKPLRFCDTDFNFAWSTRPYDFYYLQEYLPEGETFENYKEMFTVAVVVVGNSQFDSKKAIELKVKELENVKKSDSVCNYIIAEKDDKEILDFIVSSSNGKKLNFVEADIHYYKDTTINGINVQVLYFYSRRAYGDEIIPFMQSIQSLRSKWYEEIVKYDTPKFIKQ